MDWIENEMVSKRVFPWSVFPLPKDVDSCAVPVLCPKPDSISAIVGYIWTVQSMEDFLFVLGQLDGDTGKKNPSCLPFNKIFHWRNIFPLLWVQEHEVRAHVEVAVNIKQSSRRFRTTNQMSKVLHITSDFTESELYFKPIECPLLFPTLSMAQNSLPTHWGAGRSPCRSSSFSFTLPSFATAAPRRHFFKLQVSSLWLQPQREVVSVWHCWNQQPVWADFGVLCSWGQKAAGSAAEAAAWDALAQQPAAADADAGYCCKALLWQQSLLLETRLILAKFVLWCTLSPP